MLSVRDQQITQQLFVRIGIRQEGAQYLLFVFFGVKDMSEKIGGAGNPAMLFKEANYFGAMDLNEFWMAPVSR